MKNIFTVLALGLLIISCGEKEAKKKEGFEMNRTKKEEKVVNAKSEGVPVDLNNKGIGPITSITLGEIDSDMVAKGKALFTSKICNSCHMVDQRLIGPALKEVTKRRSPEWIMNMMLNPTEMLKKDPIAKALLAEYNNAVMLNQNLTETEARTLLEYLRTL